MPRKRNATAVPKKNPATGKWDFYVDLGSGVDANGVWRKRREVRRRGFATQKEAQAALDDLRVRSREGTYVARSDETVGEWLAHWLAANAGRVKPSTASFYEKYARLYVTPRIGGLRMQQVDAATLNALYADLLAEGGMGGRKLSVATVRSVATLIGKALDDAVKAGRLKMNPATAATPPSKRSAERREMQTWSATEVAKFLDRERDSRYLPAWTFLALTGCRRGEALGLTWGDVDFDNARVSIRRSITAIEHKIHRSASTKTNRSRSISLQPELVVVLKALRVSQAKERLALGAGYGDEGLVFCQADGRPYHPDHFSREFDRRQKRHGLRRIRLHDLRHTYATLALAEGVPAKVVADRLGHASVMITLDLYSHVLPAVEADHANVVARLITAARVAE